MKRKRKHKVPPPKYPQYPPPPTGMKGTKPPVEQRSYKGWGLGKLYERQWHLPNPSIKRAMLWTALFVLFLIAVTVLELALRG